MSSMDNFYEILKKNIIDVATFDKHERQELYSRARNAMMMQFECQSLSLSKEEMIAQFAIFDDAVAKLEAEAVASDIEENTGFSETGSEIDSDSSFTGLEDADKQDVTQSNSAILLSMMGNSGDMSFGDTRSADPVSMPKSGWVAAARRGSAVAAEGKISGEEHIPIGLDTHIPKGGNNYVPSILSNADDSVAPDKKMASLLSYVPFRASVPCNRTDDNVNMKSKMPWLHKAICIPAQQGLGSQSKHIGWSPILVALFVMIFGGGYWFYGDLFELDAPEMVMNTPPHLDQVNKMVPVEPELAQSPKAVITTSIEDKSLTKYQGRILSAETSMESAILKIEDRLGVSSEESFDGSVEWKVVGTGEEAKLVFLMAVPHRGTYLEMHLQRDIRPDIRSEYIVDLFYSVDNASADDRIQKVSGIMISDSIANEDGIFLPGRGTLISRGHYVIEMLGNQDNDMNNTLDRLRSGEWMMVPIVFENQSRSMFMARKGESGFAAVNKILQEWGQ